MNILTKSLSQFSSYNRRTKVPKLLKDHKYTRKGLLKVKQKDECYDLSSHHIMNRHLYYDKQKELKKEQQDIEIQENVRKQKMYKLNLSVDQCLIMELKDRSFVRLANQSVISRIQTLLQEYPQTLEQNKEMFQSILKKICSKLFGMNIDQVLVIAQIFEKCDSNDEVVQKRMIQSVQKFVVYVNHHQEIDSDMKTKLQELIKIVKGIDHEQNHKLNIELQNQFIKQALI